MPQKVLVVDDSQAMRSLISGHLRYEQLEIMCAESAEPGLALARRWDPDLILLDVHMPGTDGFEVCRQLKADARTCCIPVVFLTGAATTDEKIRGLNLGAVDYVAKPFDPAELLARVRATLRTKFLLDLLANRAMIDGLTGLWNRTYFETRLAAEVAAFMRHGQPLSCVICDVDDFKRINDRNGHPFGDAVLRSVAQAIAGACRTNDVVCRYGGEEFIVLAPGSSGAAAAIMAERLRCTIEQLQLVQGQRVPVTGSFGVAEATPGDASRLVFHADNCLYESKQQGKNRVTFHEHRDASPSPQEPALAALSGAGLR